MSTEKKVVKIITLFSDGTYSVVEPNEEVDPVAQGADDPSSVDDGGETPTKPPGNP